MCIQQNKLASLRRPKLLIRAANSGLADYRRNRDLKSISGINLTASDQKLFDQLLEEEHRFNEERIQRDIVYDVKRHISVLTALLAEASSAAIVKEAA